jgi:hypothetical protein
VLAALEGRKPKKECRLNFLTDEQHWRNYAAMRHKLVKETRSQVGLTVLPLFPEYLSF